MEEIKGPSGSTEPVHIPPTGMNGYGEIVGCKCEKCLKGKFEWWGYKHKNGSLQAKRFFDRRDLIDADESPFVAKRTHVFLASSREEALSIVGLLTK